MSTNLKYIGLVAHTIQHAMFTISIRYSRIRVVKDMFIASTAVLLTEALKCILSLMILTYEYNGIHNCWESVKSKVIRQPMDTLKICVPSFIYILQNNLLYVAATYLDSATLQVTFQLKILTTALFSVLLLGRKLFLSQWISLILLLSGIILVEQDENSTTHESNGQIKNKIVEEQNRILGVLAAFGAACCSGFGGVYFEKMLKSSDTSVWIRNVQLAACSIPMGFIVIIFNDWEDLVEKGFFYGYDSYIVYLIILQALGGLIVGFAVKHADNLLKVFAATFAIILAFMASIYIFNFRPSSQFLVGTIIIICATFLYSHEPKKEEKENFNSEENDGLIASKI